MDQMLVPPSARSPFMPKFVAPVIEGDELSLPLSRAMVMYVPQSYMWKRDTANVVYYA